MVRKVCRAAGCEEVAVEGKAHCEEHLAQQLERTAARRAQAQKSDAAKAGRRLYGLARWKRQSYAFLQRNPLCVDCAELGVVEPATDVDHIERHGGDPVLFWDQRNWQALCHACHSRKTAHEVFHRAPGVGK